MAWDWVKLKQQQQQGGGGVPPGVEELVRKFKNLKLPGGWIIFLALRYTRQCRFFMKKTD